MNASRNNLLLAAIWTIAFCVALCVDAPVAGWVHASGLAVHVQRAQWWPMLLKAPGDFRFNLYVVAILVIARQIRWKQGIFVILAGVLSGGNFLIKWMVGRNRPFKPPGTTLPQPMQLHPFPGGIHGLFHEQRDLSFVSGHACTSFALAAALVVVCPRWGWIFIIIATLTGIERIIENAHYCSDVIGGMGFAMVCVMVLNKCIGKWTLKDSAR